MGAYSVKATINPEGLETEGFVGYLGTHTISGLGLCTFGFVWGTNDIWTPDQVPVQVTWTPCDCNSACD